jgi:MFS family permease
MERKQCWFFVCLVVVVLSQTVYFYLFDRLILALAVLFPFGSLLVCSRRPSLSWLAHISLAGFTGLSAGGVLLNVPLMPMAIATTAALASWDLVLEMHAEYRETELYDKLHLKFLGAALGLGLLWIGIFHWIHWRLPFVGMLVLGISMLVCLNRGMNYLLQSMESHR